MSNDKHLMFIIAVLCPSAKEDNTMKYSPMPKNPSELVAK